MEPALDAIHLIGPFREGAIVMVVEAPELPPLITGYRDKKPIQRIAYLGAMDRVVHRCFQVCLVSLVQLERFFSESRGFLGF